MPGATAVFGGSIEGVHMPGPMAAVWRPENCRETGGDRETQPQVGRLFFGDPSDAWEFVNGESVDLRLKKEISHISGMPGGLPVLLNSSESLKSSSDNHGGPLSQNLFQSNTCCERDFL